MQNANIDHHLVSLSSSASPPTSSHSSPHIVRRDKQFILKFRVKLCFMVVLKTPQDLSPVIPKPWTWDDHGSMGTGIQELFHSSTALTPSILSTTSWNAALQWRQMLRAKDPSVVLVGVTGVTIHSWKQMEQFILQYSCIFGLYLNED